ncbi:MAG: hypothetical protein AAFZ18_21175 [Myxococcota bacterium]
MTEDLSQRWDLTEEEEDVLFEQDPQFALEMRVSMYVDGTLSPEEVPAIERRIAEEPEVRNLYEELLTLTAVAESGGFERSGQAEAPSPTASVQEPHGSKASLQPPSRTRPRILGWLAGAASLATAAVVVLSLARPIPLELRVELATRAGKAVGPLPDNSYSVLGSTAVVSLLARPGRRLRIYSPTGGAPIECPGEADFCRVLGERLTCEVPLDREGVWQILAIDGGRGALPPAMSFGEDMVHLRSSWNFERQELVVD